MHIFLIPFSLSLRFQTYYFCLILFKFSTSVSLAWVYLIFCPFFNLLKSVVVKIPQILNRKRKTSQYSRGFKWKISILYRISRTNTKTIKQSLQWKLRVSMNELYMAWWIRLSSFTVFHHWQITLKYINNFQENWKKHFHEVLHWYEK